MVRPNRAQGAHGVDRDAEDRFFQSKCHDHLLIGGMDDEAVPAPAELDQLDAAFATGFPTTASYQPRTVVSFSRGERFILSHFFQRANQNPRILGHIEASQGSQVNCGFADCGGVHRAIRVKKQCSQALGLQLCW